MLRSKVGVDVDGDSGVNGLGVSVIALEISFTQEVAWELSCDVKILA